MSSPEKGRHLKKKIQIQLDQNTFDAVEVAARARLQSSSSWLRCILLDALAAKAMPRQPKHADAA